MYGTLCYKFSGVGIDWREVRAFRDSFGWFFYLRNLCGFEFSWIGDGCFSFLVCIAETEGWVFRHLGSVTLGLRWSFAEGRVQGFLNFRFWIRVTLWIGGVEDLGVRFRYFLL